MLKYISITIILFWSILSFSQELKAYQLYDNQGKKVTFKKMVKKLQEKDIILFGELHNDPIAHWMQFELTKVLNEAGELSLGAEMFENDNQSVLNDYLNGKINEQEFDSLARLWNNYETDYKPLVEYAKRNGLTFVATNIPRRYASLVYKKGFDALDTLSEQEKNWIAPLPIKYDPELPGYKEMLTMMGNHANENFPKAQAIKDATMAHFIYEHFKKNNHTFLHFNGAYHSKNFEGIYWYLKQLNDSLKIGTINTVLQKDVNKLNEENKGTADYILVVDEDMTTTY